MGKVIAEDDELLELSEDFDLDADREALGIEEGAAGDVDEIDDGPEEIGLDVETLGSGDDELGAFDDEDDEDGVGAPDEAQLEFENELDDEDDEDGWTDDSEGGSGAWDDEQLEDEDNARVDDGGLEGVEDAYADGMLEEEECTLSIVGDDTAEGTEEDLERLELDLG